MRAPFGIWFPHAHARANDFAGSRPMTKQICGAKTRAGTLCATKPVPGNTRCRWHGGRSTGPRSAAGKAKVALNLPRVRNAYAKEMARNEISEARAGNGEK